MCKVMAWCDVGVDDRTRHLEDGNYIIEPDTFTECELFETVELIVAETCVLVIDPDPHLNIYISALLDVSLALSNLLDRNL